MNFKAGLVAVLLSVCAGCAVTDVSTQQTGLTLAGARVVVLPFTSSSPDVGTVVADSLAGTLLQSGVKIVTASQLQSAASNDGSAFSLSDESTVITAAKLQNVDFVISGSVAAARGGSAYANPEMASANVATQISGVTARIINVSDGSLAAAVNHIPATYYDPPALIGKQLGSKLLSQMK